MERGVKEYLRTTAKHIGILGIGAGGLSGLAAVLFPDSLGAIPGSIADYLRHLNGLPDGSATITKFFVGAGDGLVLTGGAPFSAWAYETQLSYDEKKYK